MAGTGRTVPELFAERGEAAFRAEESRVLAEALSGADPVVVSAAGGVVLSAANRDLLAAVGHGGVAAGRPGAPGPPGGRRARAARCWATTRPPPWSTSTRSGVRSTRRWPTWRSTSTACTPDEVVDRVLAAAGAGPGHRRPAGSR